MDFRIIIDEKEILWDETLHEELVFVLKSILEPFQIVWQKYKIEKYFQLRR